MKNYFNKIKSLVLVGAASLAFAACGDFLYIEPKTFVSEENFWNERADIDQMLAGVYVKMQDGNFINRCIMWGETRSDNITEGRGAADNLDIYRTLKEDLKSTNSYCDWTSFYAVISQCNIIIDRCAVVAEKDPTFTESDVKATKAEAAALRDLCYFYLVRAFKDVPYYTYAIQADADIKPLPAVNGDQIVKSLIEDLDSVAPYALKAFPDDKNSKYNSSRNRITQSAIYAILADLCLWDGQYQRCVDYCDKIFEYKLKEYKEDFSKSTSLTQGSVVMFKNENDMWSEGFPLYPCFQDKTFGNEYNQIFGKNGCSFESIFELAFTNDGSNDSYLTNGSIASLYGTFKSGGNNGRGTLACSDKLLNDVYNANYKVFDHKNDVRYFTSIRPEDEQYTGGYVGKYVYSDCQIETSTTNPNHKQMGGTSGVSADNRNWIFYRLTDVMLMQAEALIQLGDFQDVVDEATGEVTGSEMDDNLKRAFYLIWTVNRRSIMTNSTTSVHGNELKITAYKTKNEMLDLCLKERQRELMFEGKRWFDLLRQCHHEGNTNYIRGNVSAKISSGGSKALFLNYESLFWPYAKKEVRNNPDLNQKSYYGADDDDDNFKLNN
ncbi:MAG: RagB/SusD family nutrient uptake outer membrane protein [Bacteroidales bacterium]|nr:RagB/SusD family nutrient uptake outer membrane protein [Bacteroidales bacterium]